MTTTKPKNGQHSVTEQTAEDLIQQAHNNTKQKTTNGNQKTHTNSDNESSKNLVKPSVQQTLGNAIVQQQEGLKEASQLAHSINVQTGITEAENEFTTRQTAKALRTLQLETKAKLTTAMQMSKGSQEVHNYQESTAVEQVVDIFSKVQNETDASNLKKEAEKKLAELGYLGEMPNYLSLG